MAVQQMQPHLDALINAMDSADILLLQTGFERIEAVDMRTACCDVWVVPGVCGSNEQERRHHQTLQHQVCSCSQLNRGSCMLHAGDDALHVSHCSPGLTSAGCLWFLHALARLTCSSCPIVSWRARSTTLNLREVQLDTADAAVAGSSLEGLSLACSMSAPRCCCRYW